MYLAFSSPQQVVEDLNAATADDPQPVWMLCVADRHGEALPELLDACRDQGIRVYGGLFPGLIHGAGVKYEGIVAIAFPAVSQLAIADLSEGRVAWREPLPDIPANGHASFHLLIDCLAPNITGLMDDIYNRYGSRLVCYGAGAGYHDLRALPSVFTEQGYLQDAAVMLVTPLQARVRVRHGWRRIAGPFVASRTHDNVVQELNWEPAASFYRDLAAQQSADFAASPVYPDISAIYPLCIAKEGGEDVIRDAVSETDSGDIVFLSGVAENSVMYLAHGDQDTLIAAACQAVDECSTPDAIRHCFISDCYSRALNFGGNFHLELEAVQDALSRFCDATPEGVLALGEVANNGGQYLELFNKTFVVALTHR